MEMCSQSSNPEPRATVPSRPRGHNKMLFSRSQISALSGRRAH